MQSPGPRGDRQHDWPALPDPRVEAFDVRLGERETLLRAGLVALEEQLEELEALVASGCASLEDRDALREAFETLRREIACVATARRAVAELGADALRAGLAARRADQGASTHRRRRPGEGSDEERS